LNDLGNVGDDPEKKNYIGTIDDLTKKIDEIIQKENTEFLEGLNLVTLNQISQLFNDSIDKDYTMVWTFQRHSNDAVSSKTKQRSKLIYSENTNQPKTNDKSILTENERISVVGDVVKLAGFSGNNNNIERNVFSDFFQTKPHNEEWQQKRLDSVDTSSEQTESGNEIVVTKETFCIPLQFTTISTIDVNGPFLLPRTTNVKQINLNTTFIPPTSSSSTSSSSSSSSSTTTTTSEKTKSFFESLRERLFSPTSSTSTLTLADDENKKLAEAIKNQYIESRKNKIQYFIKRLEEYITFVNQFSCRINNCNNSHTGKEFFV
jgi:hypothetical protein